MHLVIVRTCLLSSPMSLPLSFRAPRIRLRPLLARLNLLVLVVITARYNAHI
jgi:hypothetical protein